MTPVDAAEGLERRLDARGLDVALATAIQLKHDILASGVRLTEGAKAHSTRYAERGPVCQGAWTF